MSVRIFLPEITAEILRKTRTIYIKLHVVKTNITNKNNNYVINIRNDINNKNDKNIIFINSVNIVNVDNYVNFINKFNKLSKNDR